MQPLPLQDALGKMICPSCFEVGVDVVTWWELPPACCHERLRALPMLWKPMCRAVDVVSRLAGLFNFGCMAAIHLRAREDDPAGPAG